MGYDLKPISTSLETFTLGAFSFPILLEACGYLWPCIQNGPRWYCVFGEDERMPAGDEYPTLISNDGFPVSEDEAKVMARVARNYVAVQRNLPNQTISDDFLEPYSMQEWPKKIRSDFVNKFEKFADWADQSKGFEIW